MNDTPGSGGVMYKILADGMNEAAAESSYLRKRREK